jgi:hypothetical protein
MTVLSDFTREIAIELDKLAKDDPVWIRSKVPPDKWIKFVKTLTIIDRDPKAIELRAKLEQIALREERFQDRCKAMLPLLLRLLPTGSVQ